MNESEWLTSTEPEVMLRWLNPFNCKVGKITDPDTSHLWTDHKLQMFVEACRELDPNRGGGNPPKNGWHLSACYWAEQRDLAIEISNLLREIFGNPWHKPNCGWVDGVWRARWNITPTVLAIAQSIYDTRDFSGMGQLSDALEEAGCDNWEILSHCRNEETCPVCMGGKDRKKCKNCWEGNIPLRGPHCRGCWVIDLVLGKE